MNFNLTEKFSHVILGAIDLTHSESYSHVAPNIFQDPTEEMDTEENLLSEIRKLYPEIFNQYHYIRSNNVKRE